MFLPTEASRKDELVGIGGWLILIAIGQVLAPLRMMVNFVLYYVSLASDDWTRFPIAFYGEAILNASLFVTMAYTTYLFFEQSASFPRFFILQYAASLLIYPLDLAFMAATLNMYTGQPITTFAESMINPTEIAHWIATLIAAMIWIPYVRLSKRVANTFHSSAQ